MYEQRLPIEEWKAKKQAELKETIAGQRSVLQEVVQDGQRLADYLYGRGRLGSHITSGNAALVLQTLPQARAVLTAKDWDKFGRRVNKGAKGIPQLVRVNGYYNVGSIFDVSMTYGNKPYPIPEIKPEQMDKAIKELERLSPVNIIFQNEGVVGYDAEQHAIVFPTVMPQREVLARLPAEIVIATAEQHTPGISQAPYLRKTAMAVSVEFCGRFSLPMPDTAATTLDGMGTLIPPGEERKTLEEIRELSVTIGDTVEKALGLQRGQSAPQRDEAPLNIMRPNKDRRTEIILYGLLLIPLLFTAAALAQATEQAQGLAEITAVLSEILHTPSMLRWCASTPKFLLAVLVLYPLAVYCYMIDQADRHPGAEHGTAKWGSAHRLNIKYRNTKDPKENYILTENVRFSTDSHAHKHNLNIIVIGGSGSGKTRFYVKPNALQLIGSYLFLDPKGELTRTLGRIMETKGISVTVLDLVHFQGHYNPMAYLETDEDAIKLAFAIVNNTKPKDAPSGGDKFWDDSSVLLISALILYLMYEAPASEQNFSTLMYMILNCQVSENEMVENPLMMLFGELERRDPQHPAVLQFKSFMLGAKKTLQSILISAAANLYMFNSRKFAEMTSRDEMFLPRMGLEQRALFIVLPDNDTTFNFIATMLYTQLFDQLFRLADSTPEYNGALPIHVRLMMDEFANVALPKNFKNILAVCRSRNISCDIILQNIAQLKSLFKDDWEGIIGNCDTLLYLGGNEYGTYEYLSKILGKETERTKSQSIGKGSRGSSSDSLQTAGRELCMPDEIRRMRDDECLLLMRSEDPVIDRKYNLLKHPNVKYTPDAGGEPYVIPPDYMGDAATITMDAVAAATAPEITEEMYEQLDYLEKHPEENYYENEENFSQYDQGD